jgi:hypothetical protein
MKEKHYALAIDTTQYTGNFHREMSAYVTGKVVDSYRGYAFAKQAHGKVKHQGWLDKHFVEKMVRYDDVTRFTYSDIFQRPYAELPTDFLYRCHTSYNSIVFFFDENPPLKVVNELVERAKEFAANLKSIYQAAGESHSMEKTSSAFTSYYSNLKDTSKTLDIVDVRFFEVPTSNKLFKESTSKSDPFIPMEHEFSFTRTEESFMKEHKLKKATTSDEVLAYTSNLKKLAKKERTLVSAYLSNAVDEYKGRLNEVMFLLYKIDYFLNDGLTMDELNIHYKEFGAKLVDLNGKCDLTKNMYALPYNGVQYAIKQEPKNHEIKEKLDKYEFVVNEHHKKIKEVVIHLESKGLKDIWVHNYVNGSIEAIFGNSTGVLAVLELGRVKSAYGFDRSVKIQKVLNLIVSKKIQEKYFTDHNIDNIRLKNKQ